jgi:hypothetical protein
MSRRKIGGELEIDLKNSRDIGASQIVMGIPGQRAFGVE